MPDFDSFRAPDASTLFRPLSVTSTYKEKTLGPVAPEDLVDASGNCAGAMVPVAAGSGDAAAGSQTLQQAGVPPIPAAVALDMSECDVVKRAGIAQKVDIGSDGGRRTVTMTYLGGDRPGIYRFADGRLRSMELAPEQTAATAKPAKKSARGKAAAKPVVRRAAPAKDQISVQ